MKQFFQIRNAAFYSKGDSDIRKILKLLFHSKFFRSVRNLVGFRPPVFIYDYEAEYIASDLFIWRTDHGFQTVFKSSDILKKYYGLDSVLKIFFYNHNGKFIKEHTAEYQNYTLEIIINEELLGLSGNGTFCAFHHPKEYVQHNVNITNRCYVGYGRNNSFSMVHGNIIGLMASSKTNQKELFNSIKPAINERKFKFKYLLQTKKRNLPYSVLAFSNPINRSIFIEVNKKTYSIHPRGCALVSLDHVAALDIIEVKSDFANARPIIMYDDGIIVDCLHA